MLNLAVPALSEDLRSSSSQLLWIVDIYGFFVAGSLIMGIAMLGSIGSAAYRGSISDAIPASVSPELADAARNTLAGAVAAAEQLSASPGAEVLGAARLAFAQSFELIAVVAAAVVVVTAAFVVIVLREEAPQSETPIDLNLQTAECLASS